MSEDDAYTLNIRGLNQILKALKVRPPVARVGILGDKNSRTGKSNSNATVGAAHEFGTSKMPRRSFLREPLTDHLNSEIESSGALDKDVLAQVIKEGTTLPWIKKIALLAEKVVLEGFSTGGYGKWAPWKTPGYVSNTGQILVDTQQLRNSITSEVKE